MMARDTQCTRGFGTTRVACARDYSTELGCLVYCGMRASSPGPRTAHAPRRLPTAPLPCPSLHPPHPCPCPCHGSCHVSQRPTPVRGRLSFLRFPPRWNVLYLNVNRPVPPSLPPHLPTTLNRKAASLRTEGTAIFSGTLMPTCMVNNITQRSCRVECARGAPAATCDGSCCAASRECFQRPAPLPYPPYRNPHTAPIPQMTRLSPATSGEVNACR